jgi:uncharacterized protein (TIGR02231 family)
VVVYRDRALVTRSRKVEVGPGASEIEFSGLPWSLAAESLQASASGAAIVSVELESGTEVEETERTEAVRKELEGFTAELGQIRDRIEALLAQRAYLRTTLLGPSSEKAAPGLDQVKGTLTYVGEAERQIAAALRTEQEKAEKLDEKMSPLLSKLDDPFATGRTVRVEIRADKASSSQIELTYQVWGASWSPAYNARLDEPSAKVTLEYYGVVAQSTGEAWTDARLALSTANPAISGDLPVLETWWLGSGASMAANLSNGEGYLGELDNRGQNPSPVVAGAVEGTLATTRSGGAVVFPVEGRRTIAGDGSPQRIQIGSQTFGALIELSAVPKLVPEVYRRARLKYEGSAPLLPGPVATFAGQDYVGDGTIGTVVPGEELKLAVGTDDQFKVERNLVHRTVEQVGGKKSVRYTFQYRIAVANFSGKAQTVLVSDQVPVSQREKVVVELLTATEPRVELPDDPAGLLRWSLALGAGEKKTIDLSYSVTFPREEEGAVQYELDQAW